MFNSFKRWQLRQIIQVLKAGVEDQGLKKEVADMAGTMEATYHMAEGLKGDAELTLRVTKDELSAFLHYMILLHSSKQSLLTRARIGLVALTVSDNKLMPEDANPIEWAYEVYKQSKSSKDDKRIQEI